MSNFNSFYGGRQGTSFAIVARFDGIDIPDESEVKQKYFAKDSEDYFIVPLIEKTSETYQDYDNWGLIPCDGETTVESQGGDVSDPLPLEYLQGMNQCFEKGTETLSIVNFNEYVIIDTIAGRQEYGNPDNGKIFRRGFDNTTEYIGQVMGPEGTPVQSDWNQNDSNMPDYIKNKPETPTPSLPPLTGSASNNEVTPTQVKEAILIGRPVDIEYDLSSFIPGASIKFTSFNIDNLGDPATEDYEVIASGTYYFDLIQTFVTIELRGETTNNIWNLVASPVSMRVVPFYTQSYGYAETNTVTFNYSPNLLGFGFKLNPNFEIFTEDGIKPTSITHNPATQQIIATFASNFQNRTNVYCKIEFFGFIVFK